MLVLSRKTNETIIIDGRITIEVLQIKGNLIRVGVNAPADVKILRRHGAAGGYLGKSDRVLERLTRLKLPEQPLLHEGKPALDRPGEGGGLHRRG